MSGEKKYFYGPVPSRRLGLSFGVDIVPFKVCTLDCIYCQLGKSTDLTIERSNYGPVEPILAELKETLSKGLKTEFITIAGSGEPTLNLQLGKLIEGIKKITDIPVAILTNGTLFYNEDVRIDCSKADVVIPSLDAGDAETFQKVNRPHRDINIENLIFGLSKFRDEFSGQIWLEVFFVESNCLQCGACVQTCPEDAVGQKSYPSCKCHNPGSNGFVDSGNNVLPFYSL